MKWPWNSKTCSNCFLFYSIAKSPERHCLTLILWSYFSKCYSVTCKNKDAHPHKTNNKNVMFSLVLLTPNVTRCFVKCSTGSGDKAFKKFTLLKLRSVQHVLCALLHIHFLQMTYCTSRFAHWLAILCICIHTARWQCTRFSSVILIL